MKKNLWLLLLVFVFASCDTTTGSGTKNTWSDITSLAQLHGTWVNTESQTVPLAVVLGMLPLLEGMLDDPEMASIIEQLPNIVEQLTDKDVLITSQGTTTITIDAQEQTMSSASNTTMTFSGADTEELWGMIKDEPLDVDVEFDDNNHSMTIKGEETPPVPITEEYLSGFQISKDGTKLKRVIGTDEFGELGEWGSLIPPEVIFTRVK